MRALPRFTSGTIGLSCRRGARTHLGVKGKTPEVKVPGQRESISAASAVNAKGAFGFNPYNGGLNAKRFVDFLRQLMKYRKKPLELILDSLAAHKGPKVRAYTESLNGKLQLHYVPGYAPELNPDERVRSHMKRTGTSKKPLQRGEQPAAHRSGSAGHPAKPKLVRSSFKAPSVS